MIWQKVKKFLSFCSFSEILKNCKNWKNFSVFQFFCYWDWLARLSINVCSLAIIVSKNVFSSLWNIPLYNGIVWSFRIVVKCFDGSISSDFWNDHDRSFWDYNWRWSITKKWSCMIAKHDPIFLHSTHFIIWINAMIKAKVFLIVYSSGVDLTNLNCFILILNQSLYQFSVQNKHHCISAHSSKWLMHFKSCIIKSFKFGTNFTWFYRLYNYLW